MRIKICRIQSIEEARLAVAAGADLLGLVGATPSGPGHIDDEEITRIAAWTPPGVAAVLVSSEVTAAGLVADVARRRPAVLQIVDDPEPGAWAALRAAHPALKLMQVIHVEGALALDNARAAAGHVDAILLDSGRPSAAVTELGGAGRALDWSISARIVEALETPVFLAGGLDPHNAAAAARAVRPYGLDLCSGVRTDDRLDPEKLAAFMAAVRGTAG